MTPAEAFIHINLAGIGSARVRRLLEYFGSAPAILAADTRELTVCGGLSELAARRLRAVRRGDVDRELREARARGIRIITLDEDGYPALLKTIYDPPAVLYVKGHVQGVPDESLGIGIVGSRKASLYGLQTAQRFASELAASGFAIISGMARGIDTAAHRAALQTPGGRTIAVIGSGFKNLYPQENAALAQEIAEAGAVISEFPLDTPPSRTTFPVRNRIISGLSAGIVVVEAARNSGALITADCALEQGREVFALPGRVDCATSWGGNELIRQGAALVSSPQDVIDGLGDVGLAATGRLPVPRHSRQAAAPVAVGSLPAARDPLMEHLAVGAPVSIDELVEKTGMDISHISAILVHLQMQGAVKPMPGKSFVRA